MRYSNIQKEVKNYVYVSKTGRREMGAFQIEEYKYYAWRIKIQMLSARDAGGGFQ